jgi:hypothetical protein
MAYRPLFIDPVWYVLTHITIIYTRVILSGFYSSGWHTGTTDGIPASMMTGGLMIVYSDSHSGAMVKYYSRAEDAEATENIPDSSACRAPPREVHSTSQEPGAASSYRRRPVSRIFLFLVH